MVSDVTERGLTDEELAALEASEQGLTDEQLAALEAEKPTTLREDVARGARGFVQGLKDPVIAAAQMAAPDKSELDSILREQLREYEAGRAGHGFDWGRLAGNIANPVNLVPASWLSKARTGAGMLAQGAALGGGLGALTPTTEKDDFWTTKATQAGMGAAGGAAVPAVAGAVGRVIAPKISPNVEKLRGAGVQMTPGQMLGGWQKQLEDRLTSVPVVGDLIQSARREGIETLNSAAYQRALAPINEKVTAAPGPEAMAQVHRKLSDAYDAVTKKMSLSANPAPTSALPSTPGQLPAPTYLDDLNNLRQNLMAGIPKEYLSYFDDVMKDVHAMATPQGNMSGESFNEATKLLLSKQSALANASTQNPWWGKIHDALKEARQTLLTHAEQQNPQAAAEFASVRKGWANYTVLRDAAAKATGQVFSPSQLNTAVRQNATKLAGSATGKGRLSENKALMQDLADAAAGVLPPAVPDSGTAGRLLADAAVLGGGAALAPSALLPVAAASAPYIPWVRRATGPLIAGGQHWRRPLAGGLNQASPFLAGGAGMSAARE